MAGTETVYKGFFYDDNGNYCAVYIKQSGYVGAETEVKMGDTPVVIKFVGANDNKFTHIKPTECYIEFVSTTSLMFLHLFTEPVKTYRVEIYRGIDPIWFGWVNPEFYSEPFMPAPYTTTIHCTDGLAELKNIPLPIPGFTTSDFKQTLIYYVSACLLQLGADNTMTIRVACNIVANTSSEGKITERVWEHLYIDYRALQDEEGLFLSCFDVLTEILSAFNCQLYQSSFNWRIERIDQKHTTYRVENYDKDGVYKNTTAAHDEVIALTAHVGRGTDIRFINTPAMLEIQPAYKSFDIAQDFGNRLNLLNGSSYKLFKENDWTNSTTLRYWTESTSLETFDYIWEETLDAIRIKGLLDQLDAYLINTVSIASEGVASLNYLMNAWQNGEVSMILSFDVAKRFYARTDSNQFTAKLYLGSTFTGNLYIASNAESQYVNLLGQYSTSPFSNSVATFAKATKGVWNDTLYYIEVDLTDTNDWVTTTVEFLSPPDDEVGRSQSTINMNLILFKCNVTNLTAGDLTETDGVLFRNIQLYFKYHLKEDRIDPEKKKGYNRLITTDIDEKNILTPDKYEVKFGNTPDPWGVLKTGGSDGYGLVHKCVLFDSGGAGVNYYGVYGDTVINSLLIDTIIKDDLNVTFRRPMFKLRGTVIDTTITSGSTAGLKFSSILKDYSSRYYMSLSLSYDMKAVTWDGDWLMMWDESGTGEFSDDFSDDFFI